MTVPVYDEFIKPVLHYLVTKPEDTAACDVHGTTVDALGLNNNQQARVTTSGQLVYKSRVGWAHDRLKHAESSQSLSHGGWCLAPADFDWVVSCPQPMTKQEASHLAFTFVNVRPKPRPDAVDLGPKANSPDHEELVKNSPDDRLDQTLKKLRDAVVNGVLENLLRVSPSRFGVIVLDVLHRLGYGGHRNNLQHVGGIGDGGIGGVISLDKLDLEKVYVQAKRWQNTVGRPELQIFYGTLAGQKAKHGVFITTSGFISQAHDFAQSAEGMMLAGGEHLVYLMVENEVGVSSRLLKVPKLDMDYFE